MRPPNTSKSVVCAVDHTTPRAAVRIAAALAGRFDVRLVLAHAVVDVLRPRARNDAEREQMRQTEILAGEAMLRRWAAEAGVDGAELRCDVSEPVTWLCSVADEEAAELIVVAPRDVHPVRKLVSGSVSNALARSAGCPVVALSPRALLRCAAPDVRQPA